MKKPSETLGAKKSAISYDSVTFLQVTSKLQVTCLQVANKPPAKMYPSQEHKFIGSNPDRIVQN
jgi:hypothetical protein